MSICPLAHCIIPEIFIGINGKAVVRFYTGSETDWEYPPDNGQTRMRVDTVRKVAIVNPHALRWHHCA